MKSFRTFISLFVALFSADAASALTAPYAPRPPSTSHRNTTTAQEVSEPAFFFIFGPTWMKVKGQYSCMNLDDVQIAGNWSGATAALGWRMGKYHKIQIDSSLITGKQAASHYSYSYTFSYSTGGGPPFNGSTSYKYNTNIDFKNYLNICTYSFCLPLGKNGVWELRLSPSIGAAFHVTNYFWTSELYPWTGARETRTDRSRDNDITYAAGGGIGMTIHISRQFLFDLGYRYMHMGKTSYDWGTITALNTNSLTLSAGWKF